MRLPEKEVLTPEEVALIEKQIKDLYEKNTLPSTIGHVLRDKYNVRVKKLCTLYGLNEKKLTLEKEKTRINVLKEHLKKNHKDFAAKRVLEKKNSKVYNLQKKLNAKR